MTEKVIKNPCKRCGSKCYRFVKSRNLCYCTVCGLETTPEKIIAK